MQILLPTVVHRLFTECLSQPRDGRRPTIETHGLVNHVTFDAGRIAARRAAIAQLLLQLHPDLMQSGSRGGGSILLANEDRHLRYWTRDHRIAEELLLLGMAAGLGRWSLARAMWPSMPGGVPHYEVADQDALRAIAASSCQTAA